MQRFQKHIFTAIIILSLTGFGGISNAAAQSEQSEAGTQRITRGLFSTNIIDREPVDQVIILTNAVRQVYFYTDLRNYQGQTITHRWEFEGKLVTEKKFEVGSNGSGCSQHDFSGWFQTDRQLFQYKGCC